MIAILAAKKPMNFSAFSFTRGSRFSGGMLFGIASLYTSIWPLTSITAFGWSSCSASALSSTGWAFAGGSLLSLALCFCEVSFALVSTASFSASPLASGASTTSCRLRGLAVLSAFDVEAFVDVAAPLLLFSGPRRSASTSFFRSSCTSAFSVAFSTSRRATRASSDTPSVSSLASSSLLPLSSLRRREDVLGVGTVASRRLLRLRLLLALRPLRRSLAMAAMCNLLLDTSLP
mmetsp:Transcript_34079/g.76058  ORF Transcript_34079/g.76058 Transcript_34079/m.76058 type:complete len:233 (+) Transcript_34079:519-1217(+)